MWWWSYESTITPSPSPPTTFNSPWFSSAPKTWPLLPLLSSFTPVPHVSPNETRDANHCFGLTEIFYLSHTLENTYYRHQGCLDPDGILPCYAAVVCIKYDVVFTRRPTQPMMCLPRSTDFQRDRPYHCTNHNIENFQGYCVPLCHPPLHPKRPPK